MNYLDALKWRYAVKQFSDKKVPQHHIENMIEAIQLSASAYGLQPYKLFVIDSTHIKQKLLPHSYGQTKVAECSHLFVFANKTVTTQDDIEHFINGVAHTQNTPIETLHPYQELIAQDILNMSLSQQANWSEQQCYIALGNLLNYTAIHQIDSAPMTGFDSKGINNELGLDQMGLNAAILCPVGFRSENDHSALRKKYRKPLEELVVAL